MKKILIISTGGTFSAEDSGGGLDPQFKINEILKKFLNSRVPEDAEGKGKKKDFFVFQDQKTAEIVKIKAIQLLSLDSTNVEPKHWSLIAQTIYQNYEIFDVFIVIHGTDTMPFSAAALSFALQNLSKPVVFTGSIYPINHPQSDVKSNLLDAISLAISQLVTEVCICFQGKVIRGTKAREMLNGASRIYPPGVNFFSSINIPFLGEIKDGKVLINSKAKNNRPKDLNLLAKFSKKVSLLKIFPGQEENLEKIKSRAIVLESFAVGNVPTSYLSGLEKLTKKGILVLVTTQNPFGAADMSLYKVGQDARQAGALSACNMTTETALVKLMWILGNFNPSNEELRELVQKDFCGEGLG